MRSEPCISSFIYSVLVNLHRSTFLQNISEHRVTTDQTRNIDRARKHHFQEIKKHFEAIAASLNDIFESLRSIGACASHLNALCPISRLAPEILTQIFLELSALYPHEDSDSTTWQSVSHVSRHWRNVALDCSSLWTSINLRRADACVAEFRARSKQALLSISGVQLHSHSIQQVLADEMQRTEGLEASIILTTDRKSMVVKSAPNLRALTLRDAGSDSRIVRKASRDFIPFRHIICGNAAPHLEILRLRNLPFSWRHSFHLAHLRDLRIVQKGRCSHLGSLEHILSALRGMPLLEVMHLCWCLPSNLPRFRHGNHIVVLQHLRSIMFMVNIMSSANLLTHLRTSSESSIRIHVRESFSARSLNILTSKFFEVHPAVHAIASTHLIRFSPISEDLPSAQADDHWAMWHKIRNVPELIVFRYGKSLVETIYHRMRPNTLLTGVVKLTLDLVYWTPITAYQWDEFLNMMPNIQTLRAAIITTVDGNFSYGDRDCTGRLLSALEQRSTMDGEETSACLPRLEEVEVLPAREDKGSVANEDLVAQLIACLKTRGQLGFPIRKLWLEVRDDPEACARAREELGIEA